MGPPPATTFLAEPSLSLVQTLAAPGQIGDGLVDELLWDTARGPVQTPRELVTRLVLRRWVLLLLRPQPSLDFASRRVIHDIQIRGWGRFGRLSTVVFEAASWFCRGARDARRFAWVL